MSKPYTTTTRYRLAAVETPDGRRGVAAFAGLWDTGGEAWVGRERGRLFRLPRVSADELQLWVPLAWVRGDRVVRLALPCGLDVGHKMRGTTDEVVPIVATVYALRSHPPDADEVSLVLDVDSGHVDLTGTP